MIYKFKLYVAGKNALSQTAINNIKNFGNEILNEQYELTVIDIEENVEAAIENNIFAIPSLQKDEPEPAVRIIGNLDDFAKLSTLLISS